MTEGPLESCLSEAPIRSPFKCMTVSKCPIRCSQSIRIPAVGIELELRGMATF